MPGLSSEEGHESTVPGVSSEEGHESTVPGVSSEEGHESTVPGVSSEEGQENYASSLECIKKTESDVLRMDWNGSDDGFYVSF